MTAKALIIGINLYDPPGGPNLRGCVADANDFANTVGNVLNVVRPVPASMKFLIDHTATRQNILNGLNWLTTGTRPEDLRILYYPGHGTQVIDKWPTDEPDGKDEAICPHDYYRAGVITDDEMAKVFSALPSGANLETIFDCCHSGTGTREINLADRPIARCAAPPSDQAFFLESNTLLRPLRTLKGRGRDVVIVPGLNHVLWAACRDAQLSQELAISGVVRGAFTYWFCKILRKAGVGGLRHIIDSQVTANVKATVTNQLPQLEAQRAAMRKPIFGATRAVEELEAERVMAHA